MYISEINTIKLQGANFTERTPLKLFSKKDANNKDVRVRFSLLYGKNGAGKTAISKAFSVAAHKISDEKLLNYSVKTADISDYDEKQLSLSDEDCKNCFIFNEDYINQNIKIDKAGLDTIVVLGGKVEIEKKLEEARDKLSSELSSRDKQQSIVDSLNNSSNRQSPKYWSNKMQEALRGDNNWAGRDSHIRGNKTASRINENSYKQFVGKKEPLESRDTLVLKFQTLFDQFKNSKAGNLVINNPVPNNYEFKIDESVCAGLLAEKIEKPELSEREKILLTLVNDGKSDRLVEISTFFGSSEHKVCPYCLQDVNETQKSNIIETVQKILNKKSDEHKEKLQSLLNSVIQIDEIFIQAFIQVDSELTGKIQEQIKKINEVQSELCQKITDKISNVYEPITVSSFNLADMYKTLNDLLQELENKRVQYNKKIMDVGSQKIALNQVNSQIAYWDLKEKYESYAETKNDADTEEKKLAYFTENVAKQQAIVTDLEAQKEQIEIAVEKINKGLSYIFFSSDRLTIEVDNDSEGRQIYKLKSRGDSVTPGEISVGERNAIALCYFFSNVMQGKEEGKIFEEEYLFVIDDPVSSFDIENRVGILSYLRFQLNNFYKGNLNSKFLLMTHDLQAFFDMQKFAGEFAGNNMLLQELTNKTLISFNTKKRQEYTSLICDIFDYCKNIEPAKSLTIGNSMRRVLEAYSTFLYKESIEQISIDEDVIGKIEDPFKTYYQNLLYRLVLNGDSHSQEKVMALGSSDFFNYISDSERQRTARDIIVFLYLLDKQHILKQLKSKGNIEADIEAWKEDIRKNGI